MWEGVGDRTELQHIDPHSYGQNSVSFPFYWAAQPGVWEPSLSGCWCSLPHLIFNWLNFLYTELYNGSTPTFFLWASQIALIQPIHGQGYILIFLDRMHLLFTQVHFLFWQPGRVGGQYTTTESICKIVETGPLENFITQDTKVKLEKIGRSIYFRHYNWEITLSIQTQENKYWYLVLSRVVFLNFSLRSKYQTPR